MDAIKWVAGIVGILVVAVALSFALGVIDLGFTKFFKSKMQNIERQVFEQTQSYAHGKTQDLAKYFEEYRISEDKETIRQIILMNFADFDETTIRNLKLRNFLTTMRGY